LKIEKGRKTWAEQEREEITETNLEELLKSDDKENTKQA
jgi:hypothetical protein